ncbi:MAG: hypothetical protein JXB29_00185 [Sedimentisphaerales bacterium]|nr:hypothetical protein [Sedimentisphaerales bacterium]
MRETTYTPDENRYDKMKYNRSGKSGLLLPAISLGLWHNFGDIDSPQNVNLVLWLVFQWPHNGLMHMFR